MKDPFADLIPDLRRWNNGEGIDVDGWIVGVGRFDHAIGYSRVFWPEFVEHDGCIFAKEAFDEQQYQNWLGQTRGDRRTTQAVINHVHVADLFSNDGDQPTHEQMLYLGRTLRDMWEAKLNREFPDAHVVVTFTDERCEALVDYEVTFFRDEAEAG